MQRSAKKVFINHCGVDTKRNIVGLLHDNLVAKHGIPTFLDRSSMKAGDKMIPKIEEAIDGCKVGVVVLSPRYCHSYFCLHELALLMEAKKRIVPIFFDIQPSQIRVMEDTKKYSAQEFERFTSAIREATYTVGIYFDSSKGDWTRLLRKASNAVRMNLTEVMEEENRMTQSVKSGPHTYI